MSKFFLSLVIFIYAILMLIPTQAYASELGGSRFINKDGSPTRLHIAIDLSIGLFWIAVPIVLYVWLSRKVINKKEMKR